MRATRWLLGMGTAFSVLSAVAAGCGSSTTGSSPAQDSGTDVTTEAAMEAAAEAAPEAGPDVAEAAVDAPCVPDANITMLPVPDASFGDAGATAATCLSCFETNCMTIVTQCNMSCGCVSAFETFGTCLGAGGSLLTCGGAFATNNGLGLGITSLACALGCAVPQTCGVSVPTGDGGGGDTGTTTDSAASD